jgi:hypothetical protein
MAGMFWLYLTAWVWILGTITWFALFWISYESMWADAEADEHRPPGMPVGLFILSIAACWPAFVVYGVIHGRPRRPRR